MKSAILLYGFLLAGLLPAVSAQEMKTLLASDFQAENQVVQLDIQSAYYPLQFKLGIVKGERVFFNTFYAREGAHHYDLRTLNEWEGKIDFLVTNLDQKIIKRHGLEDANLKREWDVFLDKEEFSPSLVNFLRLKSLRGNSIVLVLFFLTAFLSVILFYFYRNWISVVFIGLLAACILFDGRILVDHFRIIQQVEKSERAVNPLQFVKPFAKEARSKITGNWAIKGDLKDEYYKLYLRYAFADLPYITYYGSDPPTGTFVISSNRPENDQSILHFRDGYYLYQQP